MARARGVEDSRTTRDLISLITQRHVTGAAGAMKERLISLGFADNLPGRGRTITYNERLARQIEEELWKNAANLARAYDDANPKILALIMDEEDGISVVNRVPCQNNFPYWLPLTPELAQGCLQDQQFHYLRDLWIQSQLAAIWRQQRVVYEGSPFVSQDMLKLFDKYMPLMSCSGAPESLGCSFGYDFLNRDVPGGDLPATQE